MPNFHVACAWAQYASSVTGNEEHSGNSIPSLSPLQLVCIILLRLRAPKKHPRKMFIAVGAFPYLILSFISKYYLESSLVELNIAMGFLWSQRSKLFPKELKIGCHRLLSCSYIRFSSSHNEHLKLLHLYAHKFIRLLDHFVHRKHYIQLFLQVTQYDIADAKFGFFLAK